MQVRIASDAAIGQSADALVVPVFSDGKLDGAAAEVDAALGGAIAHILSSGENTGKLNELTLVHAHTASYKRALVIGLGDRAKFKPSALAKFAGTAVRYLGKRNAKHLAFALPQEASVHPTHSASFIVEGAITGTIDTTTYRTEKDKPIAIESIILITGSHDKAQLEAGAKRGEILGEAINATRLMALTPANDMTPTHLANRAKEIAAESHLEFSMLDEAAMEKKGMGSLLGVSRGSDEPATMTVLKYMGDPSSKDILALVGKGLTFDTGGISIKPAENMHEMKYDMCGGAGVIGAMAAIGKLKPKVNVIGIVPSSENMPGSRAMKPGDILKAMNGKTIEVINTDAEGRLILADALCYAAELGATRIIDCATLTGACVVALGSQAAGTMTNNDEFVKHFLATVADSGERYWQLPLYDEFSTIVKSEIADLRNSAGRMGGAETGGAFLRAFVKEETPWIHLDIAGTAYLDSESPFQAKGPTGVPVRAFVTYVEEIAKNGMPHSNGAAKVAATV